MSHTHDILDDDICFTIDPVTRAIVNNTGHKITLMQYDHNSERFTFELPRYIEGLDMTKCVSARVHYINVGTGTSIGNRKTRAGIYEIDDMEVIPDDEEFVTFSWLVSQNATQLIGSLNFVIRFTCSTDGELSYSWSTAICTEITISDGIYNGEDVVEQYADVLEQWKALIDSRIIKKIEQTIVGIGSNDINEWTITFGDGSTAVFHIRNGGKGDRGDPTDLPMYSDKLYPNSINFNSDTNVSSANHQSNFGTYNAVNPDAIATFGNGKSENSRSNAFEIISNESGVSIKLGSTDLTETQLQQVLSVIATDLSEEEY